MDKPKLVILRGIEFGNKFYTTNDKAPEDIVKLNDGTVVYEIVDYADTDLEAQEKLFGKGLSRLPKF